MHRVVLLFFSLIVFHAVAIYQCLPAAIVSSEIIMYITFIIYFCEYLRIVFLKNKGVDTSTVVLILLN